MEERTVDFAKAVFEIRAKLDKSQEWLADQLGVSTGTISNWELGRNIPDKRNAYKIKRLLEENGITISQTTTATTA